MKKTMLFLMVLLSISTILSANKGLESQFTAKGIKGGLNFSTLEGNRLTGQETKVGMVIGFFAIHEISELVSFQPEILFSMKGCDFDIKGVDDTEKISGTINIDYIEIPLILKFNPNINDFIMPNLYLGGSLGVNVSSDTEMEYNDVEVSGDIDTETFESTFLLGGGLDFGKYLLDARYSIGLSKVDSDENGEITNSVFSLTLGMKF